MTSTLSVRVLIKKILIFNNLSMRKYMNFKPLHDRVLVKRVASDEKTAGGIIIPDTAQEKPMEGQVLEVGSGSRNENGKLEPLDVKKGDKILFGKWSGTEVKMNGDEYLIMKESDIMGIITSGKKKK
jgi:chaperonin GroES